MKIFMHLCALALLAFQIPANAQNIQQRADSVTTLLCKKWEIDYAMVEGKKVDIPPSTPKVYIEFYKDGTWSFTGDDSSLIEKGTWKYDASKGTIFMLMKGKDRKEIISLTKDQFATSADDPPSIPTDSSKIALKAKVYFKVKRD
jgi:hypothetical protein